MKICQVVPRIDEEASGPSYSVPRLSESLSCQGNMVVLTTLKARNTRRQFEAIRNIEFESAAWAQKLGYSPSMKNWFNDNAKDYDIIHSHGLWMMPNVYPLKSAHKCRVPCVVSPRGTLSRVAMSYSPRIKSIFWALKQKPALKKITAFHATSEEEYLDIRRAGFHQPIAVIPNGIDLPESRAPYNKDKKVLISLGRIHPKKGLELAIRVWSSIQDDFPDWQFRIIGKGEAKYIASLRLLIAELNGKRILFEDALYGDEKNEALRSASLFLLTTRNENFGMVVAEALALGVPVIATQGAPWEGLESNGCGWWVERNEGEISVALIKAMQHPAEKLAQMGVNGQTWMKADFSWNVIGLQMQEFYTWLISARDKPEWVRTE